MAVATTTKKVSYTCNGSTGPYPITFAITLDADDDATNLGVLIRDSLGGETPLDLTDGYTVSGLNVYTVASYDNTNTILLYRIMPFTRSVDNENGGEWDADQYDDEQDAIYMHLQELQEIFTRNLYAKISETIVSLELPLLSELANNLLGFAADGTPIPAVGITAAVSTFMETVLDDTSADAALATLGFGAFLIAQKAATQASLEMALKSVNNISSADYTVLDADGFTHLNYTTGASDRNCILPTESANTKRIIDIGKVDSGAGTVYIIPETGRIDGLEYLQITGQYSRVILMCDGTNWTIISEKAGGVLPAKLTGTADGDTANKLVDSGATFSTNGIAVGYRVENTTDGTVGYVKAVDSETQLSIKDKDGNDLDLFPLGTENYSLYPTINRVGSHEFQFIDGNWSDISGSIADITTIDLSGSFPSNLSAILVQISLSSTGGNVKLQTKMVSGGSTLNVMRGQWADGGTNYIAGNVWVPTDGSSFYVQDETDNVDGFSIIGFKCKL